NVLVWGRNHAAAKSCAADLSQRMGIPARAEVDAARVVRESQLVVTTTPSQEPLIKAEWLHLGLHITANGSDKDGKNEIDPAALAAAEHYVCDRASRCESLGEERSAIKAGLWHEGTPTELGELVTGSQAGRTSEDQITICDLSG